MASARSSPPSTTLRRPLSSSTMLFSACINVRMTITQLAAVGNSASNANPIDLALCKIYAASVPSDLPTDKLLTHFFVYGKIKEGSLDARVFTAPKCSPLLTFSSEFGSNSSFIHASSPLCFLCWGKQAISSLKIFVDAYKSGIHEGSIAGVGLELPGFYYDPEKNRYFPIKGPIPGSSSKPKTPALNSPQTSSNQESGGSCCRKLRNRTLSKLLQARELDGHSVVISRYCRSNFTEEFRKMQASRPVVRIAFVSFSTSFRALNLIKD
ncbi:hypothetical protein JHK82_057448 [Glycine max]|nr:hypothetical protein JHK82_057448 [Glycine max]